MAHSVRSQSAVKSPGNFPLASYELRNFTLQWTPIPPPRINRDGKQTNLVRRTAVRVMRKPGGPPQVVPPLLRRKMGRAKKATAALFRREAKPTEINARRSDGHYFRVVSPASVITKRDVDGPVWSISTGGVDTRGSERLIPCLFKYFYVTSRRTSLSKWFATAMKLTHILTCVLTLSSVQR